MLHPCLSGHMANLRNRIVGDQGQHLRGVQRGMTISPAWGRKELGLVCSYMAYGGFQLVMVLAQVRCMVFVNGKIPEMDDN